MTAEAPPRRFHIRVDRALTHLPLPVLDAQNAALRIDEPTPGRGTLGVSMGSNRIRLSARVVLELLAGEPDTAFSTDTVALRLSLSRTTARRYLEYLESEDRVDVDLNYGQRGRPERRYHWRRGN